ncbi:MAG: hypothetical protein U0521_05880 [Anaerolineae bacterium]
MLDAHLRVQLANFADDARAARQQLKNLHVDRVDLRPQLSNAVFVGHSQPSVSDFDLRTADYTRFARAQKLVV